MLNLTKSQNSYKLGKKRLENIVAACCSDDETRYKHQFIYYRVENQSLYATDGHRMAWIETKYHDEEDFCIHGKNFLRLDNTLSNTRSVDKQKPLMNYNQLYRIADTIDTSKSILIKIPEWAFKLKGPQDRCHVTVMSNGDMVLGIRETEEAIFAVNLSYLREFAGENITINYSSDRNKPLFIEYKGLNLIIMPLKLKGPEDRYL